jgi:hypothetical protein
MKSPFPGMDPYIEISPFWEGFHGHLIAAIDQAIGPILPRGYYADLAARRYVVVMESEDEKPLVSPDLTITELAAGRKPRNKKGTVAPAWSNPDAQSVLMRAFLTESFKETCVEIYAAGEEPVLVTCIEVLSPANKRPNTEGWDTYLRKRRAMLLGQANFIEIDLLRGGHKMPMLDPWPDSLYSLLVCRQSNAPYCRVWPAHFRDRLPPIPVPLSDSDPDLTLDLQPLIDGIYSLGRYDERIDYSRPLTPALSDADAVWVRDLLKDRVPRSS